MATNINHIESKVSQMNKTEQQQSVEQEFGVDIFDLLDILFTQLEYSYDEISEKIGVPRRTANTWINDLGVTDYTQRMDANVDSLDRGRAMYKAELQVGQPLDDWLFEQYWVEGRSTYDIGKGFGSAGNTVGRWMKRLGVERRDDAEQFANHWDQLSDEEKKDWVEYRKESGFEDEDGFHLQLWRETNGGGSGEDHPRWVDNSSEHVVNALRFSLSSEPWVDQAQRVKEKYDNECFMCSDDEATLHVHHIVPIRFGGVNEDELLIPLCPKCHRVVESETARILDNPIMPYGGGIDGL